MILLLPYSSLCLVLIISSAANKTLLQARVLQRGRKHHANFARVEDFVRGLGYNKRNGSVSGLNYTLPSSSHSRTELMIAAEGVKTRLQEMSLRRMKSEKTFWLPKELTSPHVEGENFRAAMEKE